MSIKIPTAWTTGSTEIFDTGTWRSALPIFDRRYSPCRNACPIGNEISTWIQHLKKKAFKDAWLAIIRNNPFPAVTGRICHHPCEASCNRDLYDETISICDLERYIGDLAIDNGWDFPLPQKKKNKKTVIVGGGPSGLSAAYHLNQQGFDVTIIEQQNELGGLLRYGIPDYRLPKSVLSREIKRLLDLGIQTRLNTAIRSCEELEDLYHEFDAVYMATGAQKRKRLPQLDYEKSWVIEGAEFLAQSKNGEIPSAGENVVVIGGGSAAFDVARTAVRHGRTVHILSLESINELPAQPEEVKEAREEGIQFIDSAMIVSVELTAAKGLKVNCINAGFEKGPSPGQIISNPIPGTEFVIETDTIIPAIGQDLDASIMGNIDTDCSLIKIGENFQTSREAFFAGGDAVSYDRYVSNAIGDGKKAALSIADAFDPDKSKTDSKLEEEVSFDQINTYYYPKAPNIKEDLVTPAERQKSFVEVRKGITEDQSLLEAERCFSCGNCILCNNCYYYCPDMAVKKDESDATYSVRVQYCKGCGLCVNECPTGSIILREEIR